MWFRKRKPKPADVARGLRDHALSISAEELGLERVPNGPRVYGAVMETGYPEAVVSLVCFADGSTSLYFSSGGGIIGGGERAVVQKAAISLLASLEQNLRTLQPTSNTPLPPVGGVRFYVRTFDGLLTAEASEEDLGEGRHPLAPVFHAAHEVITALRLIEQEVN